jgi:hypothetical protein
MSLRRHFLLFAVASTLIFGQPIPARADSPLTSTDLASAYQELPIVALAKEQKAVRGKILYFLLSDAPSDRKAAVINALGWNIEGQENGYLFLEGLASARGMRVQDVTLKDLSSSDRFVLGYLLAMDDYSNLSPLEPESSEPLWSATPLELLSQAAQALPDDFTVHFVRAIVQGQANFSSSWCSIYLAPQQVLKQFSPQERNMRPSAVAEAMEYLRLYKESCDEAQLDDNDTQSDANPDLNSIYKIAKFRGQIATATQGGVVIWNPKTKETTTVREESICGDVLVWQDDLWVGCQYRLLRFDGETWTTYIHDPNPGEGSIHLLENARGELLATHKGQLLRFDPDSGFLELPDAFGGESYDIFYRRNGERWSIDFLAAIIAGEKSFPLRSQFYPGSDPRSFYEDPDGRLWVVDFESGFYQFDEQAGRFIHLSDVGNKGSAIAVDPQHERLYLLHYTDGLYIKEGDAPAELVNLSALEYMRDLYLDDNGDLWVGGWNQLLRLRKQGNSWKTESFKI